VFGVLEVILRHDPVPGQSFGVGEGEIAFIVSSSVLSVPRLGAGEPGGFISLLGLRSSRHGVRHSLRIWARLHRRRFKFRKCISYWSVCRSGRQKPDDIHSRNCRVGYRGEGSHQALMGAGSWVRHSVNNEQSWPNGSRSTELTWEGKVAISSCWLNLSLARRLNLPCHIDRVARFGDAWRTGLR
jgi:hypothetical protein